MVALQAATVALLVAVAALLPPTAAAAAVSKLWGLNGSLWTPSGPLPDFSFAGYHQGNDPLPTPNVTRSVLTFRKPGMTDTQMLVAAVKWAHNITTTGYTVLFIPPGTYNLTQSLPITKSRIVMRGAGAGRTVLNIPKSLKDIYGGSPNSPTGSYVRFGAFIVVSGDPKAGFGTAVAAATGSATKGSYSLTVNGAPRLRVGQYYDMWWTDVGGRFNRAMFDGKESAPVVYNGATRVRFTVRVVAIRGTTVTLERPLPYAIAPTVNKVTFYIPPPTVSEVGVEGLTFRFKWELYAGHHLERGWNAVELDRARDCWVRDVEIINPDSGVLINDLSASITVRDVKIWYTRGRANNLPNKYNEPANTDGHWGLTYAGSFDILFTNFVINGSFMHDVGTGMAGKWGVFANGRMTDGNLDLHRGLAGPTLYTNIHVGKGTDALDSGGPKRAGPNSLAFSTWWNIRSAAAIDPPKGSGKAGSCAFAVSINIVGADLKNTAGMCSFWLYERGARLPFNIYEAQLAKRKAGKS